MFIVTGGAGFIGSAVVRALNHVGETDVLVVDDLRDARKVSNLAGLQIADYADKDDFLRDVERNGLPAGTQVVFHQGANADTTAEDGRAVMRENYSYSKTLLHAAVDARAAFVYASSAAVYGRSRHLLDRNEPNPLSPYAYSKYLLDVYASRLAATAESAVVGLRYHNVYGPGEQHKDGMASVALQFLRQAQNDGEIRVFGAADGYDAGEHRRDWVHVDDVAAVNLFFGFGPVRRGVFDVGTGTPGTFNDVAQLVAEHASTRGETPEIRYVDFPERLLPQYQPYTQADLSPLRAAGFRRPFTSLHQGVTAYLDHLTGCGPRAKAETPSFNPQSLTQMSTNKQKLDVDFCELDVQEVEAYLQEGGRGIGEYAASCGTIKPQDAETTTIIQGSCSSRSSDQIVSDFD
ncbi:MAG: ADP-glyceromanno-heptose 6-epimerase [Bacteroidota bacterium]